MGLTGTRNVSLQIHLLTLTETRIGRLPTATTVGGLSYSAARTIRTTGEITCVDPDVDWLTTRIAPVFTINGVEYPAGVYVPSVPDAEHKPTGNTVRVQLMDKLTILSQDRIADWLTIQKGTVGTDAVRSIIEGTGESAGAITPSTETLRTEIVFEPGTTKLQVINLLLEAINYFSLWCDSLGQYRAEPYTKPVDRPLAHVFDETRESLRTPNFGREQDLYGIPNSIVVMSQATGDDPALIGRAENNNPDSPFSIVNRGRTIFPEGEIETIEATSQAVIDEHANRRLIELSSPTAKLSIAHAWVPLELNDAVGFASTLVGTSPRATVTNMEVPLDLKQLVTTQLREVVDV